MNNRLSTFIEISLPIELWDIIAKYDLKVYHILVHAIPSYGRRMSHPLLNRDMRIHFTESAIVNGNWEWRLNGKRHREDGPAIEKASGDREWWLRGWWLYEGDYTTINDT